MSDGTIINGVYAARIHKINAADIREDAADMLRHYQEQLLLLAASTPCEVDGEPWCDYVHREVRAIVDDMEHQWWRQWAAGYIAAEPGNCKDELVDADWEGEDEQGE